MIIFSGLAFSRLSPQAFLSALWWETKLRQVIMRSKDANILAKRVPFCKLQHTCSNKSFDIRVNCQCNLSLANWLQLVEKTCNKTVDNKFWKSIATRKLATSLVLKT